jgi:heterodisulfide reductase subunit B
MTKYIFYPGCAMDASARAYNESLMAIKDTIGLELEEVRDWNCCGATEYLSISQTPAYALIGRNLALASKQANGTKTVVASCSACYLNLTKADHKMHESAELNAKVNEALAAGGLSYKPGSLEVRHLLDVINNEIGLDKVKEKVVKPLKGLRVAPYLGCMVPRPDYNQRFSNPEYPKDLDNLLKALGAEVIDFPLKTHCCGGHMTQISPNMAYELIRRLLSAADQYKADVIVTVCPMCQMNLDAFQHDTNRHFGTHYNMPILFFTQLMGVAFGKDPNQLGFGKEIVNASAAMSRVGVTTPEAEEAQPKRKKRVKETGLPMPAMPGSDEEES